MLLAIMPQGTAGVTLDANNCVSDCIYRLGLTGAADLAAADWISSAELLQFADDAAKRLSWKAQMFLVWDQSVAVTSARSQCSLPYLHVFTIAAWLAVGGVTVQLRPTSASELWALNSAWMTASGTPTRISFDAGPVGTATLYPTPPGDPDVFYGTLKQVCQLVPATLQAGATTISLPLPVQDYFTYAMLAAARGKESEHAAREMATHYRQRCDLYEAVFDSLWGPGQ